MKPNTSKSEFRTVVHFLFSLSSVKLYYIIEICDCSYLALMPNFEHILKKPPWYVPKLAMKPFRSCQLCKVSNQQFSTNFCLAGMHQSGERYLSQDGIT